MGNKPDDPPKTWTPDQPLEDKEDEEEAQLRAKRSARVKFLEEGLTKPPADPKKKKSAW